MDYSPERLKEIYEKSISSRCWWYTPYDDGWNDGLANDDWFDRVTVHIGFGGLSLLRREGLSARFAMDDDRMFATADRLDPCPQFFHARSGPDKDRFLATCTAATCCSRS
jgi:hypothetical protein